MRSSLKLLNTEMEIILLKRRNNGKIYLQELKKRYKLTCFTVEMFKPCFEIRYSTITTIKNIRCISKFFIKPKTCIQSEYKYFIFSLKFGTLRLILFLKYIEN